MTQSRKPRIPKSEQLKLIHECRKSGMTDADWCRLNDITPSTFYNWLSRARKDASIAIPEPNYGHTPEPLPKPDIVPVEFCTASAAEIKHSTPPVQTNLDNAHVIEVLTEQITIRISNGADLALVSRILGLIQENGHVR